MKKIFTTFALFNLIVLILASCAPESTLDQSTTIKYSEIIDMNKEDVRSILGISIDSRWEQLSHLFEITETDLPNNILSKDVVIEDYNASIVVFIDDNNVYQLSLIVEQQNNQENISLFLEAINREIEKNISIKPTVDIVENDDGSILEQIVTYVFARKTFFINISRDYVSINLAAF